MVLWRIDILKLKELENHTFILEVKFQLFFKLHFSQKLLSVGLCHLQFNGNAPHLMFMLDFTIEAEEFLFFYLLQSILKWGGGRGKRRDVSVRFPSRESEVIGYGGDPTQDTDSEDEASFHHFDSHEAEESSEDDTFLQITNSNTRFNSLLANLSSPSETSPVSMQPVKIQLSLQPFDPASHRYLSGNIFLSCLGWPS